MELLYWPSPGWIQKCPEGIKAALGVCGKQFFFLIFLWIPAICPTGQNNHIVRGHLWQWRGCCLLFVLSQCIRGNRSSGMAASALRSTSGLVQLPRFSVDKLEWDCALHFENAFGSPVLAGGWSLIWKSCYCKRTFPSELHSEFCQAVTFVRRLKGTASFLKSLCCIKSSKVTYLWGKDRRASQMLWLLFRLPWFYTPGTEGE